MESWQKLTVLLWFFGECDSGIQWIHFQVLGALGSTLSFTGTAAKRQIAADPGSPSLGWAPLWPSLRRAKVWCLLISQQQYYRSSRSALILFDFHILSLSDIDCTTPQKGSCAEISRRWEVLAYKKTSLWRSQRITFGVVVLLQVAATEAHSRPHIWLHQHQLRLKIERSHDLSVNNLIVSSREWDYWQGWLSQGLGSTFP